MDDSVIIVDVQEGPSTSASTSSTKPTIRFHCPILNCGAGFTSQQWYNEHMERSQHSPCHPFVHLPDSRLSCTEDAYICPVCGQIESSIAVCQQHMVANNHDELLRPLKTGGFICPHCLQVFPSRQICQDHMNAYRHHEFSYPFKDDIGYTVPQRAPAGFIDKFRDLCFTVSWSLQCISCDTSIDKADLPSHIQRDHIICAVTDMTAEDVFAQFLKGYSCIKCLRLFDHAHRSTGGIHHCDGNIQGIVIENDCRTFEEFIRRLSLPECQPTSCDSDDDVQILSDSGISVTETTEQQKRKQTDSPAGPSRKRQKESPTTVALAEKASNLSLEDEDLVLSTSIPTVKLNKNFATSIGQKRNFHDSKTINSLPSSNLPCIMDQDEKHVPDKKGSVPAKDTQKNISTLQREVPQATAATSSQLKKMPETTNTKSTMATSSQAIQRSEKTDLKALPVASTSQSNPDQRRSGSASVSPPKWYTFQGGQKHDQQRLLAAFRLNSQVMPPAVQDNNQQRPTSILGLPVPLMQGIAQSRPAVPLWIQSGSTPMTNFSQLSQNVPYRFSAVPSASRYLNVPAVEQRGRRRSPSRWGPRPRSRSPFRFGDNPPPEVHHRDTEPKNLDTMKQIIFLDLDNWPSFFKRLPEPLPARTFVWGFFGGASSWNEPFRDRNFLALKNSKGFFLHPKCGRSKDAADFALVMTVGRMDERLPKEIAFTILSGDRGFVEVERQMSTTTRRTVVINPHHKENQFVYALIKSVADS